MLDRDAPRTCEALRAAVLQLDMVGFTTMSEKLSPMEVRVGRHGHYTACRVLYSNYNTYIAHYHVGEAEPDGGARGALLSLCGMRSIVLKL